MSSENPTPDAEVTDLPTAGQALLAEARTARAGRAAQTLVRGAGAPLKQTLLALVAGTVLADHESPGSASLQVLSGHVHLTVGDAAVELTAGDWTSIPPVRHGVEAVTDAVLLITVAVTQPVT